MVLLKNVSSFINQIFCQEVQTTIMKQLVMAVLSLSRITLSLPLGDLLRVPHGNILRTNQLHFFALLSYEV